MTDNHNANTEGTEAPKKSLAEAAKRMLEQKKQAQAGGAKGQGLHQSTEAKKMKSQMTKKINNQKRRTGV
jgi:hypothetical protein